MDRTELQAFMDASPFIRSSRMRITETHPERESLTMVMPLRPEFERAPPPTSIPMRP